MFFDEAVDIHHIFPEAWCNTQKIEPKVYDTVINKTPLSYRTNRIIGGVAPSKYLAKLEAGKVNANGQAEDPPIASNVLDCYLQTHCVPVASLRSDDFVTFMKERRKALVKLIEDATGHKVTDAPDSSEGEEPTEEIARDNELLAPNE